MRVAVSVEQGLAAHFTQRSGPSRPGVDWAVRITGDRPGMVIVRTYFSTDPPHEAEKAVLADQAARFVTQKLAQGWTPQQGSFLELDDRSLMKGAPEP